MSRSGSNSSLRRRAARAARRAFTLIELMIVVAIVGILAVIAVVGYRKIVLAAKVTEARNVIGGVRIAQEGYKVERGVYANLGAALCPLATSGTGQFKTQWDPTCGAAPTWAVLPLHVDGPVQFGYATIAGTTTPPTSIGQPTTFVTIPASVGTNPWYYVTASADLDGNGGMYTELVGTSWQNTIFVFQEGE
jgi:type IV pilus assembly protein PilA